MSGDAPRDPLRLPAHGKVRPDNAGVLESLRQALQFLLAAGAEDETHALGVQPAGDEGTESAGGAREKSGLATYNSHAANDGETSERAVVSEGEEDAPGRLRRLDDVLKALEDVPAGEMPPIRLLFRLSELGVKDPSSQSVEVLRRRVLAIKRLYTEGVDDNPRTVPAGSGKRRK